LGGVLSIRVSTSPSRFSSSDFEGFAMTTDILTKAHTDALGLLIYRASKLDSLLTDLIAQVAGMNILAAVITVHHQQFGSKIDTLKALYDKAFGDDDEFKPMFEMIDEAKAIGDYRNAIVHCIWQVGKDGKAEAVRFSARGKLKHSRTVATVEEIQKHADAALALSAKLASLRDHLLANPEVGDSGVDAEMSE
jgi:hypothetical protein